MRLLTAALLCLATLPLWAEGEPAALRAAVYFEDGADTADYARQLEPLKKASPATVVKYVPITTQCKTMHEAVNASKAVVAGVTEMPCLVLSDDVGEYMALPLRTLTAEQLKKAPEAAADPERRTKELTRRYRAKEYLLFARMSLNNPMSPEILELCLASCRALMAHPDATTEDKQLLGLRCLYPLLMLQYTQGYKGAHTPETEAKLLEAIAALEQARDLDPQSKLGKQAYDERERLRTARRKARQYE